MVAKGSGALKCKLQGSTAGDELQDTLLKGHTVAIVVTKLSGGSEATADRDEASQAETDKTAHQ